ncbi:Two-component response regulator ORR26 [Dichanthelium oligosanthes]|uniref:Two-component response regulator ORR26 n=1 Tax=Dichanthelium oligosanthes TaxID=888268 RepID=A0A1E5VJT1_9POAL|nr:Two-component response regulator ORR26 [Dichanthelium oligosanthes]
MALADATAFPYGLRVLVVDDDPTWLKILEKMLRKCSYEVMSIDGETSRVMKGVQHGACDYLLKPVRMKELRNIWQHVYRKKMHEVKEIEEVGPKKILDLMNVPGLTRENVASHLQKYRLYLSRLQKQNEERIMGAARQDFSQKGPSDNLNIRISFQEQPGNGANGFQHNSQKIQTQTNMLDPHLEDTKIVVPLKVPDKNGTPVSDVIDPQNVTSASPLGGVLSFERMPVNQDRKPSENMILECQSWSGSVPPKQFMQYPKHNHERCDLLGDYSCLPKPDLEHPIGAGHLYAPPPLVSMSCSMEGDVRDFSDVKPDLLGCMKSLSPALTCTVDSVSAQLSDSVVTSTNSDQKFSSVEGLSSTKDCYFDQARNQAMLLTSEEASIICGTDLACLPDDLSSYQLHGIGLNSIDLFQCNDPMILHGLQNNWYDDPEPSSETMEFPLLDGCLFA